MALAVLHRLGLQRAAVTEDLEGALASVGAAARPATEIPFSPEAARALERPIQQARNLESNWVGTEHLLLGLLDDGHSLAARTLNAHGVRIETALETVLNLLGEPGPEPRASFARGRIVTTRRPSEGVRTPPERVSGMEWSCAMAGQPANRLRTGRAR